MTLSDEARDRLADVVELQPTKNGDLQERWDMESGSAVHQYLETELGEFYFRDDNSLIRATEEAAELVDVEPGIESDEDGTPSRIRVPELEASVLEALPDPDGESMSVVAVLHAVRDDTDLEPDVDAVRDALQALRRKGAVEVEYRTVPTYRRSAPHGAIDVEIIA